MSLRLKFNFPLRKRMDVQGSEVVLDEEKRKRGRIANACSHLKPSTELYAQVYLGIFSFGF